MSEKYNIFIPKFEKYCPEIARNLTHNIFSFPEKKTTSCRIKKSEGRVFLISDEEMAWLKQCDTNFISDFYKPFPDYKIEIAYYLRKIDDYLRSLYSQCIKDSHGYLFPYGHYSHFDFCKEEFFSNESSESSFLPSKEISYLYSLVGKENVKIRLYDKNTLLNGDIADDFFLCLT